MLLSPKKKKKNPNLSKLQNLCYPKLTLVKTYLP